MSEREDAEKTADTDRGAQPGMPRWVKVFVVIAVALVVLLIAAQFIGGGHGPRRHGNGGTPATEDGGHTPPVDHTP